MLISSHNATGLVKSGSQSQKFLTLAVLSLIVRRHLYHDYVSTFLDDSRDKSIIVSCNLYVVHHDECGLRSYDF